MVNRRPPSTPHAFPGIRPRKPPHPLLPRGFVPSLHAGELSISRSASVSQGFLAVLSTESQTVSSDGSPAAGASTLGRAAGATGRGVAFRDGALHNLRLGGTTTLEGDLDLAGHRLLNSDMAGPKLDELEVKSGM